ncbi:NAD kinase [Brevibacillus halotolerans]|nr:MULTISPECIES: NAD kinase [Brevibacillus]MCR8965475.1 NAD kinase [Brevibacillus laterosporus]MCZ0837630.1 NAD kinase [Brevibacillus halotolerans]
MLIATCNSMMNMKSRLSQKRKDFNEMKIATVLRNDDHTRQVDIRLREKLAASTSRSYRFLDANSQEKPDMVLSIGGDGTMLEAVHQYGFEPHYIGIHTGHLGFYADWHPDQLDEFAEALEQVDPLIAEYPTVSCQIRTKDGQLLEKWALNELVIRNASLSSLVVSVFINEQEFEHFRGDGLIISSPSGSTAYNKAVDGALLHPSLEAIQLAEIASINNQSYRTINSALVLPKHHQVELIIMNPEIMLGMDREQGVWKNVDSITCRVGPQKVKFARYKRLTFWDRVRKAFIHG